MRMKNKKHFGRIEDLLVGYTDPIAFLSLSLICVTRYCLDYEF
jgi:hypothetical protein